MCICINCRWVDRCMTYHSVERQHGVEHLTETPDVKPEEPLIHVSVIDLEKNATGIEWDVRACKSFVEDHGRWRRLRPNEALPT